MDIRRIANLLEALAFCALIALYIWKLQVAGAWTWSLFLAWLLVSLLAHRDTPKTLGWRADNLKGASQRAVWFFLPAAIAICVVGLFLGMPRRLPLHLIEPRRFAGYFSFCLLQQVALNSFLTNRLLRAFEGAVPASLAAGVLFAALHWPNPVLVPLTLIAGVAMAWLFACERNVLPLTVGQAILGALVWWAFPIAWHHSMRVGPGYYTFHL